MMRSASQLISVLVTLSVFWLAAGTLVGRVIAGFIALLGIGLFAPPALG